MKTIHKHILEVEPVQNITLPTGSKIILAKEQGTDICLWYETDTSIFDAEIIKIYVIGTGHSLPDEAKNYLGTAMLSNLVFHVYE